MENEIEFLNFVKKLRKFINFCEFCPRVSAALDPTFADTHLKFDALNNDLKGKRPLKVTVEYY